MLRTGQEQGQVFFNFRLHQRGVIAGFPMHRLPIGLALRVTSAVERFGSRTAAVFLLTESQFCF